MPLIAGVIRQTRSMQSGANVRQGVLIKVVLILICLLIYSKSLGLFINCSLHSNKTAILTRLMPMNKSAHIRSAMQTWKHTSPLIFKERRGNPEILIDAVKAKQMRGCTLLSRAVEVWKVKGKNYDERCC